MFKILNGFGPEALTDLFTYKSEMTNYKLYRDNLSSLCLPQPHTDNIKNYFMYDGAQLWNFIPNEFREIKSLSLVSYFKKMATHIYQS